MTKICLVVVAGSYPFVSASGVTSSRAYQGAFEVVHA
jgi:hypothetical protein